MVEQQKKWVCPNCRVTRQPPEGMRCDACGMNLGTSHTKMKHDYLKRVIELNQYDFIIDACAGAGKMILRKPNRSESPEEIIIGSAPLIEKVKKPSAECSFIECEKKTWKLLKATVKTPPILGDCNHVLPRLVDGVRKTLVFMDPNGYGVYPIRKEMLENISQMLNTDLLIHFSHLICRNMGFTAKYYGCDDERNHKKAESYRQGLNEYWGSEALWRQLCKAEPPPGKKKSEMYVESYAEAMLPGNQAEILRIPERGRLSFFLILLTKFQSPPRGLERFF